ncbi:MAG: glycosyltransferase family 39 protein [Nostoc sp. NMS1]|uniref:ArnT family glycosyltransferase n=1 Tax=unclassified Nostoc TaxID=2593658 RepID=UPI0025D78869|nr:MULTISPECIES: glycosyltransferase family 39 protein [unclassified Nostoc]MBN3905875.1 glycosyltransferase family 39 protein [Nostoc sp. NMS1]MBN3992876.1 glycosyltransferase family 39 protein [Nostoc sp. NMS2]
MFIFLPIISLIAIFLLINKSRNDWRESAILSATYWGILLTAITEFLSFFKLIAFGWILGTWGLICIILIYIYFRLNHQILTTSEQNNSSEIKKDIKIKPFANFLLYGVVFVVAIVGLIAIIAPPNNWDSMDYHMSRVAYWIQNHSIANYPTNYTPQLYQNPWSEFVILHFQILSGGDYFANLVQWFSMIGCIIGVSLIAKKLEADLRGQVFSAVITATIPMGILQASSTQNDYVLAFWIVCLAYYLLSAIQAGKNDIWTNSFNIGSSTGLAILSKGTAYFYVFPFLIWFGFYQIKSLRWKVWKPALIVGSISLLLNISHYLRNYHLFASPLGEPGGYRNEVLGVNILISNILRNVALHIGTPIGLWNGIANKLIQIIHIFIGVDINDPRITFSKTFFVPGGWSTIGISGNENSAGNLVHLALIIICIIIFLARKSIRKESYIFAYLIATVSTFLIFCYLVKWQAWNSRLHLPFFVLISPFIGVILSKLKKQKIAILIVTFLLVSSLPWVFFNRYRPIIDSNNIFQTSRIEQYFSNRPYLKNTYIGAVDFLNSKKCSNIGLSMGNDPWEYPLWVLLQQNNQEMVIQHINVTNISAVLEKEDYYKDFEPCGIISMETKKSKHNKSQEIDFKGKTYLRAWDSPDLGIFIK